MALVFSSKPSIKADSSLCSYDINLTPDKRQALLHNEAGIFLAFQEVCVAATAAVHFC